MDETLLRTFQVVAEEGSITKASRKLFLTQPAVSQHVSGLEAHFGVRLFDRGSRGVRLTRNGEVLLEKTRELFGMYRQLNALFEDLGSLKRGKIILGVTAIMSCYILPPFLLEFKKRYPEVEIECIPGNTQRVARMVLDGKVDIGFGGCSTLPPTLLSSIIHKEPLLLVGSSDNPLTSLDTVTFTDLKDQIFIDREQGTEVRELAHSLFVQNEWRQKKIVVGRIHAAKHLVAEGNDVVTVLPEIAVRRELDAGTLAKVSLVDFTSKILFSSIHAPDRSLHKAAQIFLCLLGESRYISEGQNLLDYVYSLR